MERIGYICKMSPSKNPLVDDAVPYPLAQWGTFEITPAEAACAGPHIRASPSI